MKATELIENLLEMNNGVVDMALDGLSDEQLNESPSADTNHAGWLLWHKVRVEDAVIAHIAGGTQEWVDGGWSGKLGLDAAPDNIGFGQPPESARAMKFTKEGLTGYAKAVREKTKGALKTLSPEDMGREIPDLIPNQTITVGAMIGRAILLDNFQHSGQIAYLRGFYTGYGWLPF